MQAYKAQHTLLPESEAAGWCLPSSECLLAVAGKASIETSPTTMPCLPLAAANGRPSAPAYPYTPATMPVFQKGVSLSGRCES